MKRRIAHLLLIATVMGAAGASAAERTMPAGPFGTVTVYTPEGKPQSVVLFLSGDGGWQLGVVRMAQQLTEKNTVVVGIDVRRYLAAIARAQRSCRSLAGDFENLSHAVQKQLHLSEYHVPVLIGYSSGATIVYATLAQGPPHTFAGAMSLGFCPDQDFKGAPLCPGTSLHYKRNRKGAYVFEPDPKLQQPWVALQGQQDMVCPPAAADRFAAAIPKASLVRLPKVGHGFGVERNWLPQFLSAYDSIREHERTQVPRAHEPSLQDLPLTEVPASAPSGRMALIMTGDGGWAGLDQELAARLAANSVSVVGLNSLKYFWTERSADQTAADVARVLRHYLSVWHSERILLIGYSFGAEVLPFVANRLPEDLRGRIVGLYLLGPGTTASFEIHVADWIPGLTVEGVRIAPEVERLRAIPTLCIQGAAESDSLCPTVPADRISREVLGEGHHFSGDYAALVARILAFAAVPRATRASPGS
jgi:type IV secretory pathway VirJ component